MTMKNSREVDFEQDFTNFGGKKGRVQAVRKMHRAEITASASICDIVDCVQVRGSDRLARVHCAFCGLCTDRNDAKR